MTNDDIPMWAKAEAVKRLNAEGGYFYTLEGMEKRFSTSLNVVARLIAKHEPEPVDPLLVMVREACGRVFERKDTDTSRSLAAKYRSGRFVLGKDNELDCAMEALRMAQEQGWEPRRD